MTNNLNQGEKDYHNVAFPKGVICCYDID